MLLLPHHHEFAETLTNLPFFYQEIANKTCEVMHVIQKDPNHLPEMVNVGELQEYLLGGEANQFVEYVDGYVNADAHELRNDNCLPLWKLSDEWLGLI